MADDISNKWDHINPVQFGRLIQSVETLTLSVDKLNSKVNEFDDKLNTGKGIIAGLGIASAAIGGSVGAFIHKIFP